MEERKTEDSSESVGLQFWTKTQLEILELEMRARVIRAMLAKKSDEGSSSCPVALSSADSSSKVATAKSPSKKKNGPQKNEQYDIEEMQLNEDKKNSFKLELKKKDVSDVLKEKLKSTEKPCTIHDIQWKPKRRIPIKTRNITSKTPQDHSKDLQLSDSKADSRPPQVSACSSSTGPKGPKEPGEIDSEDDDSNTGKDTNVKDSDTGPSSLKASDTPKLCDKPHSSQKSAKNGDLEEELDFEEIKVDIGVEDPPIVKPNISPAKDSSLHIPSGAKLISEFIASSDDSSDSAKSNSLEENQEETERKLLNNIPIPDEYEVESKNCSQANQSSSRLSVPGTSASTSDANNISNTSKYEPDSASQSGSVPSPYAELQQRAAVYAAQRMAITPHLIDLARQKRLRPHFVSGFIPAHINVPANTSLNEPANTPVSHSVQSLPRDNVHLSSSSSTSLGVHKESPSTLQASQAQTIVDRILAVESSKKECPISTLVTYESEAEGSVKSNGSATSSSSSSSSESSEDSSSGSDDELSDGNDCRPPKRLNTEFNEQDFVYEDW